MVIAIAVGKDRRALANHGFSHMLQTTFEKPTFRYKSRGSMSDPAILHTLAGNPDEFTLAQTV